MVANSAHKQRDVVKWLNERGGEALCDWLIEAGRKGGLFREGQATRISLRLVQPGCAIGLGKIFFRRSSW